MIRLHSGRAARAALVALLATLPIRAQDAERAAHGDEAVVPQRTLDAHHDGLTVRQYQLGCLSQLTYLLTSGPDAVVVDPQRDVEHYLTDAKALGATIRFVVLTHTNADFVAGHTELLARSGATVLISEASGSEFPHRGMKDGDRVPFGTAELEFLATPGHTLDSMTILVRAPGDREPRYAITGDALFIGSIGRPDLASGVITPMALADLAFDSVQRLAGLPDATIVLPGHGAGSLCGAHLSPDTTSTIGREKATNPFFAIKSRAAFVARDVSGLPVAPQYFAFNVALNRKGPPVVDWTAELPPALAAADVATAIDAGAWVIDVRDAHDYAKGHVAGSVNIAVRGRLDTWTGIVVPFDAPLILVGNDDEVREAVFRFRRIGLDAVRGALAGGIEAARAAGIPVRTTELLPPKALAAAITAGTEPIVVDVRTAAENEELRIGDYAHIALADWPQFGAVLDRNRPVLFVCNSAYRSSMAVGLAERLGFTQVASLDGGLDAWLDAGLPVHGTAPICIEAAATSAQTVAGQRTLLLPEIVEPRSLATALQDQPQSYAILDVRPAWQFAEYHVPGATNVTPDAAAAAVRALPHATRVVLVDRDGTLAFAVAGAIDALLGAEAPSLRVLAGGTTRYFAEIEVTGAVTSMPATAAPIPVPTTTPPTTTPPKKRSAGC